jgi:hypothetical protein
MYPCTPAHVRGGGVLAMPSACVRGGGRLLAAPTAWSVRGGLVVRRTRAGRRRRGASTAARCVGRPRGVPRARRAPPPACARTAERSACDPGSDPGCLAQGVDPWIEIDGGVTPANAYKLIDAGANALVSGSAVFGAKSYKDGARAARAAPAAPCLARLKTAARVLRATVRGRQPGVRFPAG